MMHVDEFEEAICYLIRLKGLVNSAFYDNHDNLQCDLTDSTKLRANKYIEEIKNRLKEIKTIYGL